MMGPKDRHRFWIMMIRRHALGLTVLLLAAFVTFLAVFYEPAPSVDTKRWQLPRALKEVSGLAVMDTSHVLTVTDEQAIVYRINLETGAVDALFAFGNPPIKGDFEGITVAGKDVYIINSRGHLYRGIDGLAGGDDVAFEVFDTGLEEFCEVEGLHYEAPRFLIACKTNYRKEDKGDLLIYEWTADSKGVTVHLHVPTAGLIPSKNLNPSGVFTVDRHIYLVAAKQDALLLFDRNGALVLARELKGHPQAEGIVVMPDGTIVIADEGKSKGGTITRYEPVTDID